MIYREIYATSELACRVFGLITQDAVMKKISLQTTRAIPYDKLAMLNRNKIKKIVVILINKVLLALSQITA